MMTSSRPYLIRAIHEWLLDNGLTPYILVNTKIDGTRVPEQYVEDDKITFNLSYSAIKDLHMGNEEIEFSARFQGAPIFVRIPIKAILTVYAKETGVGMTFQEEPSEENDGEGEKAPPPKSDTDQHSRPALRIVK